MGRFHQHSRKAPMKENTGKQQHQHITTAHYQEWLDSAVAPAIIALNVKSLSGNTPYEYLIYSDDIKR